MENKLNLSDRINIKEGINIPGFNKVSMLINVKKKYFIIDQTIKSKPK